MMVQMMVPRRMEDGADDGACGERRRNRDVDPNASGRLGVIVVLLEKKGNMKK